MLAGVVCLTRKGLLDVVSEALHGLTVDDNARVFGGFVFFVFESAEAIDCWTFVSWALSKSSQPASNNRASRLTVASSNASLVRLAPNLRAAIGRETRDHTGRAERG